jgi:hypothetical protein
MGEADERGGIGDTRPFSAIDGWGKIAPEDAAEQRAIRGELYFDEGL